MELMDFLAPLLRGAQMSVIPSIFLVTLIGALWGMVAGALPGIGSVVAMAMMLPFTLLLEPVQAVALLVSLSMATGWGNGLPAVVVGVPGSPAAFLTAVDGHALHNRGESGLALGTMFFAVVSGQWISVILFAVMVVPLSQLAFYFLAPEFFALSFLGLTAVVSLTGRNVYKGLAAAAFGVFVSLIGPDPINFVPRFHFGIPELRDGLSEAAVVIGVLALSELLRQMRQSFDWADLNLKFDTRFPKWSVLRGTIPMTISGTFIGTFLGAVPGVGSAPATMVAYQQAQIYAKHPERFGKGSVEAVAANESAGSASNSGELVPTLALGIPGSSGSVILLTALLMHGFPPGPNMLRESPEILDASVAGLIGCAIVIAAVGWYSAKLLLKIAMMNRQLVLVISFMLTSVGIFAVNQRVFDVFVMLVFGFIGYFGSRYGYSTAALALGMILGGGFEGNLRQGIVLMRGSWVAFFTRPYTAIILVIAFGLLFYGAYSTYKIRKGEEDEVELAVRNPDD